MVREKFIEEGRDSEGKYVKLVNDIGRRVDGVGLNKGRLGTYLADIYFLKDGYQELINRFLTIEMDNPEMLGAILTDLKINVLESIYLQRKSVKRVLQRIIDCCYQDDRDAYYMRRVDGYVDLIKRNERLIELSNTNPSEWETIGNHRIQVRVRLANSIGNKIKALGFDRVIQGNMGAILSDIYMEIEGYTELIDNLLSENTDDQTTVGGILVDIQMFLEQLYEHYKSVRNSLDKVVGHCYARNE